MSGDPTDARQIIVNELDDWFGDVVGSPRTLRVAAEGILGALREAAWDMERVVVDFTTDPPTLAVAKAVRWFRDGSPESFELRPVREGGDR